MKELDVILDNGTNEPTDNAQPTVKDESRLTVLSEQVLSEQFVAAKERKEALEAELKAVKAEIERLDREFSDEMILMEYDSFSRKGKTFFLKSRLVASPKAGCKAGLFSALRKRGYGDMITESVNANTLSSFKRGYGDMITESVNANTLSSFVKEKREENDGEIPEWLTEVVNSYEKTTVGTRTK